MLGERLTNLLSFLTQDEFVTLEILAMKMNLSSKTVRNLLRQLDEELTDGGAHIVYQRGKGFMLEVTDLTSFQRLFISDGQTEIPPANSAERVHFIIREFLKSNGYIKIEDMCDMVYVSRKTLTADIKKAEEFFEEFHLQIERKPHYGMRLVGDEVQMRHCMARVFQNKTGRIPVYDEFIEPENRLIGDCLLESLKDEEYHISDVAFNSLVLHIQVSIHRIRSERYITAEHELDDDLIVENDYRITRKCVEKVGKSLDIVFPEEEIRYLAIHFAGKEYHHNLVISSEIQDAVNEMLQEIYEVFQIDFREDLELIVLLGRHLVPLIIRMKYGMRLENPLLQEIKTRYSLAYTMAIQACAVLERRYGSILDSNEISYIALAFALSLEKNKGKIEKKKVLFVCASGAGTAKLVAYKMQQSFQEYIGEIVVCDQRSIAKQDFSKIDYVFTTIPIKEKIPVPICEVTHLFPTGDFSEVRKFLHSDFERDILEYYPEELFFTDISGESKEEILEEIISRVGQIRKLPAGFHKAVLKREKLARTCMGNQVAMPHPCKVMTEDTFVSVSILKNPVKWDETQYVQVVFLVSVSKQKNKKIQNFYSTTANLLLNRESIEALIKNKNYHTLTELLSSTEAERSN